MNPALDVRCGEQPVRQHRRLRVRIDLRSDRKWAARTLTCGCFRVRRQLVEGVHGQGHAIVARVEDRFTNLDVELVAAARLGNRIGENSRIIRCAAAGSELLRIAEFVLDQHVRRFQQNKMGRGGGRRQQNNCDNGEACGIFHLKALPVVFECSILATLSHQKQEGEGPRQSHDGMTQPAR